MSEDFVLYRAAPDAWWVDCAEHGWSSGPHLTKDMALAAARLHYEREQEQSRVTACRTETS
jgi:hypothetical protein